MTTEESPFSAKSELFFGIARERLFRRARWGGLVLLLSFAVPYENIDGVPQFIWQIFAELPAIAILSALALSLAGLVILAAAYRARRALSLSVLSLVTLFSAVLLGKIGADRALWEILPLPDSISERPIWMILGLAAGGASINLSFRSEGRPAGRALAALSLASVLAFYFAPSTGEAPALSLLRLIVSLPELPFRMMLGYGLIASVMAFPAFAGVLCVAIALSPPGMEPRLLARLVTFGFPGLLSFFVFRSLLVSFGNSSLPGVIGAVAVLAALLGTLGAALEVGAEGLLQGGSHPADRAGWRPLALAGLSMGVAGAVLIGAALLSRPPDKGVAWALSKTTKHDHLYGTLLPQWNLARARWSGQIRKSSGARAMVKLKASERRLKVAARGQNPEVGAAVVELIRASRDLDLAGRRWHRLITQLNEANRKSSFPYYVDPALRIIRTRDGLRRLFDLNSYRIEKVNPVEFDGERFATLQVRSLGKYTRNHNRMGFSRDRQAFALVVIDEIEDAERHFQKMMARESCGPIKSPAFETCKGVLGKLRGKNIRRMLVASTTRHELQHQIDGPELALSSAVLDFLGGYQKDIQTRVNRELSAYLAELTVPDTSPKLGLIGLLRMAHGSGALRHVGELTARSLGGGEDTVNLDSVFMKLFSMDEDDLRRRAKSAWSELFEDELPSQQWDKKTTSREQD